MKIWYEDFDQDDLDADFVSAAEMVGIPLTTGTSLMSSIKAPLKVRLRYRRIRPAAFQAGPIVVVDEGIRERTRSAQTEIEFLPVDVTDVKTREVLRYHFLNVLSELDCLDRTRSEYEEIKGHAKNISRLALKSDCPSLDFFRLAWTIPSLLVVSDQLAGRLAEVGRLGLKFVDVESYVDPALV